MRARTAIALIACLAAISAGRSAERFDALRVGQRTYRNAIVLSVNDSSIVARHAEGISQILLENLDPELQLHFGYDPALAAARTARLESMRATQAEDAERRLAALKIRAAQKPALVGPAADLAAAARRFGQAPELREEIDLRERYKEFGLTVRNQWAQPSCAIFATVAALEYQFARYGRGQFDFSESYLFDATLMTLGLSQPRNRPAPAADPNDKREQPSDAGFALDEVLQAIRTYGLALEGEAVGRADSDAALARAAFGWRNVPGRDSETLIANMIHLLNTETPLVVSLAWPHDQAVTRSAVLSEQTPRAGAGHAVALVGYRCRTGNLEDATFIFRNSWGPSWGAGGYGYIRYAYLAKNLRRAYVVEPQ